MAINWRREADNIIDTSDLFADLDAITSGNSLMKGESDTIDNEKIITLPSLPSGYFYDEAGNYLGKKGTKLAPIIGKIEDKVFVLPNNNKYDLILFANYGIEPLPQLSYQLMSCTHTTFKQFAGLIYQESYYAGEKDHSESEEGILESYAIGNAVINFLEGCQAVNRTYTFAQIVGKKNTYAYGAMDGTAPNYIAEGYKKNGKKANSAAINALFLYEKKVPLEKDRTVKDYSEGACQWDGIDLAYRGDKQSNVKNWGVFIELGVYTKWKTFWTTGNGKRLLDITYDPPKTFVEIINMDETENKFQVRGVAQYGTTIFWKYNEGNESGKRKVDFFYTNFK